MTTDAARLLEASKSTAGTRVAPGERGRSKVSQLFSRRSRFLLLCRSGNDPSMIGSIKSKKSCAALMTAR